VAVVGAFTLGTAAAAADALAADTAVSLRETFSSGDTAGGGGKALPRLLAWIAM
jgi:hypothetical protein